MKKYHIFEYQGEGSFEAWIKNMAEQSESALHKLNSQELFDLILRLPEGYRAIFNLYEIEGFKHAEIAQKLGINISIEQSKSILERNDHQTWTKSCILKEKI